MTTMPTTQEPLDLSPQAESASRGTPLAVADIVAMLRRRMGLIIVLFILSSATAVGGFAAWWTWFPGYRSESLIECVSNIPDLGLSVERQRLRQDERETFVMSQAVLLKSPSILGEALKVTVVRETDWYRNIKPVGPNDHLLNLTERLSASPVRGTNFLRVAMECRKAQDSAIIINEVVSQWFQAVKKRTADEFADAALTVSQSELQQLDREIVDGRNQLKTMAERLPAGARQDPGGNITNQEVKELAGQIAELELEKSQLEQYRQIYNDPAGVAVTAEDRAFVELDPEVGQASQRLFLLTQQRSADERVYGPKHTVLKQLDAQIEATQATLIELRTAKLNERRADIREATNTAYENTRHALFLSKERMAEKAAALQDQDRLLFDYTNLDAEITQKILERQEVDAQVKSLDRIKSQRTAIKVNIAQPATDPLKRSSPNPLLLIVGIFAALAFSTGSAIGLELLNTSVRTAQDIARHLDVASLGVVPHTDDEEVAIASVETAIADAPQSMIADGFRRIRANLQFSAPIERQRTILVTSPKPDDGRTTVACNLAMALALGGRRVLLIDANFRRPRIGKIFPTTQDAGLSNLLIDAGDLRSLVSSTSTTGLDVLHSGPTPPNPVDLLGSEACRKTLEEARGMYDQVVIDSAPVLLASDALVLGTMVDGVVLVLRANQSSRGVARRACALLDNVGANLFGAVLNAAQVTRGGYFREELRAYYEYQADMPGDAKS